MAKTMVPASGWELDEYDQNMNLVGSYPVIGFLYDDEQGETAAVYVDSGEIEVEFPNGLNFKLAREER